MKRRAWLLAAGLLSIGGTAFGVEVGDEAPEVLVDDIQPDGTMVNQSLTARREHQTFTIIDFFLTTCGTCQRNFPVLVELAAQHRDHAEFRQVAADSNEVAIYRYLYRHATDIDFPVALDLEGSAREAYGLIKTPTLFIINAEGIVVYRHQGALLDEHLEEIEDILGEENNSRENGDISEFRLDWFNHETEGIKFNSQNFQDQVLVFHAILPSCGYNYTTAEILKEHVHQEYEGENVILIDQMISTSSAEMRRWEAQVEPENPMLVSSRQLNTELGVRACPTISVVDCNLNIQYQYLGVPDDRRIREMQVAIEVARETCR